MRCRLRSEVRVTVRQYERLTFFAVGVVVAVLALCPLKSAGQVLSAEEQKLLDSFTKSAQSYIANEHALPANKLKPTSDIKALEQQRLALRESLRQSRPDAKQGEFFKPPTAILFRKLLVRALTGPGSSKVKTSLNHAEPEAPAKFVVNGEYPNRAGQPIQSVPPTVLQTLPTLPKGLEYGIAGKTLALRDTNANIVVDFLPDALP